MATRRSKGIFRERESQMFNLKNAVEPRRRGGPRGKNREKAARSKLNRRGTEFLGRDFLRLPCVSVVQFQPGNSGLK